MKIKKTQDAAVVNLLIYTLYKLVGIPFASIHFIPLNIVFNLFFNNIESNEFLEINFNKDSFKSFQKHRNQIISRIETNINKNSKIFINNEFISYVDLHNKIKSIMEKDLEMYKNILEVATTKNAVLSFHTLHLNLIWFHDLTKLEMFDHCEKGAPYLLLFLDCASWSIVYYKLFDEKGEKITSKDFIKACDEALSKNSSATILHSDSDHKNYADSISQVLGEKGVQLIKTFMDDATQNMEIKSLKD